MAINPKAIPYIILLVVFFVALGITLICISNTEKFNNNNNIVTNNVWTRRGVFRQWNNLVRRMNHINIVMTPENTEFITMFGSQPGNNFSYVIYKNSNGKYGIMKRSSDNNNILIGNNIILNQIDMTCFLGQGCVIYGNLGQNTPEMDTLIVPCSNGKIQFRNKNNLNILSTVTLTPSINNLRWVDMDSVTNHLLVPNSYQNLTTIKAYQINLNPYSFTFKVDIPLNIAVPNVVSGRVSYNGHLYFLSEDIVNNSAVISCYEIDVAFVNRQPSRAILKQQFRIQLLNNEKAKSIYIDSARALVFIFVVNNLNKRNVKILKYSLGVVGSANI